MVFVDIVHLTKFYHFDMFALSVATATVSVDTIIFCVYILNFIFSVFTRSIATATVSLDTMEFGQPFKKHHFNMFALSVATATVSVDTIIVCVHINNFYFLRVYTKRCYCNR